MNFANIPRKLIQAFAGSGVKNDIPNASQVAINPGAASFADGFPPATLLALASGGIPPSGKDFNGILYILSSWCQWAAAGNPVSYDQAFANSINGYPYGASLISNIGPYIWLNTVESNVSDPDHGGTGWVKFDPNALTGFEVATNFLQRNLTFGTQAGGTTPIAADFNVPLLARRVYIEAVAGGGPGGSGNISGAGGGGSGGAGTRGWLSVRGGQVFTGHVGNGGFTSFNGMGGAMAGETQILLDGAEIIHLLNGGGGALGGSAEVAGDTRFGIVANSPLGFMNFSGQSGGNGILTGQVLMGGQGGGSMFGCGGLFTMAPNVADVSAPGNGSSYFGAAGSGGVGPGIGAPGGPGAITFTFFG